MACPSTMQSVTSGTVVELCKCVMQERTREEAANAPAKTNFETFTDFGDEEEAAGQPADDAAEEKREEEPLSAEAARWQAVPDLAPIIASCTGRSPNVSSPSCLLT